MRHHTCDVQFSLPRAYIHFQPHLQLNVRPEAKASLHVKRKENNKLFEAKPRGASHKFILRVDRFVEMYKGHGLERYDNLATLAAISLLKGCETGKFPEPLPAIPAGVDFESFSFATDQEQSQITGGEFILTPKPQGLGLTGARFADPFHRWNNDTAMATALSGLATIEKAATLIFNIGYGPWQAAAFFHLMLAEGQRLPKTLTPSGQFVMRFWRRRLVDTGMHLSSGDDIVGEGGRKRWLDTLPGNSVIQLKGVKVQPAKWMSLQQAGEIWDTLLSTRALVMGNACLNKGWVVTAEDLFAPTSCGAMCGDKPAPTSKAAAFRSAKAKLDNLKKRTQNTFVAATKLICDDDVINGIRILLHGTRAQYFAFSHLVKYLTSPEKSLAFAQQWAESSWLGSLKETLLCLQDTLGLSRCGLVTTFLSSEVAGLDVMSPQVVYQDALAKRLACLVDAVLQARCGSLAEKADYYPFKLARLTSGDPATVKHALEDFHEDVSAWWLAKDIRAGE